MDKIERWINRWRGTKCGPDYIRKQKIFQSCMLLVCIVVGVSFFLVGFFITKTRANVFTVMAMLTALPAANRIIVLVIMIPRQSVEKERYDRMKEELLPKELLLTDYVFTSEDKVMSLDFVVIGIETVTGICPGGPGKDTKAGKKNREYMLEYLQKEVRREAPAFLVEIVETDEEFYAGHINMEEKDAGGPDIEVMRNEIAKGLKTFAV